VLLKFTNFYQRFIQIYLKVTLSLTELLEKTDKAGEPPKGRPRHQKPETCGKVIWQWMQQAKLAFRKLKRTFPESQILQHFDPAKPVDLQVDATGFAIAGILNQYDSFRVLRRVSFYSWKCSLGEQN
jgi:hypothetical protein